LRWSGETPIIFWPEQTRYVLLDARRVSSASILGSERMDGHSTEALALGDTALAAHDKLLGRHHAWTKDSARVTADALDALGRAEEAKELRERYGVTPPENPHSS
jgi:hypothetical protein